MVCSRGRGRRKERDVVDLKVLHMNCDGYISKKESIENIVNEKQADVLLLNETALKGNRKVRMKNYFSYSKNRVKAKGGVATVVANYLKANTVKVAEGQEGDEYIITRIDNVLPPVNIVNIYGQQESRTQKEEILASWMRLREDLSRIESSGEGVLIVGDLNRAVGSDELGVIGNHDRVSYGGQLIREMVEVNNYICLNNLAEGGPWTWVQRGKEEVKSCLDLAYASQNLMPFIKSIKLDKDKEFTPRRVIWKNKTFKSVYTDHFPMEIILHGMPRKKRLVENVSVWNMAKPGGWKNYKELTDRRASEINVIAEKDIPMDEKFKQIENIEKEIKFEAFGKTRVRRSKPFKKVDMENEDTNEELLRKQSSKIENEILRIKSMNLGRTGNVFKMKEVINGPKKGSQAPTAIKHPISGELIVANEEIKNVTLAYCVDNLTKQHKDETVVKGLELKQFLHNLRMKEEDMEDFDITVEDYNEVMIKFGTKSTKSYDFLLKSGKQYKAAVYKMCREMILQEEFPTSFRRTVLHMIWKSKGPAEILQNNRFIHMKDGFWPRLCEALCVKKMKGQILSSSSKYQVGGQPGHSPEEHIFTIKSLWAKLVMEGSGMILTLVDIISFFDRENIYDVMQTLHEIGVDKKAARVWFKLNEKTEIAVKTAGGVSDTTFVGDCIGQGTAGGALVSQANLDHGLGMYFDDSQDEMLYGRVRIQPLAYQDDVLKGSEDVLTAQIGNIRLAAMLQEKGLEAHPEKTSFIVVGSEKFKKKVKEDIRTTPLMFGSFKMIEKVSDKYLGQFLHGGGLEESALATVQAKAGKIKGATMEIKSIIEEFQMQALGGMEAASELWERALVPSLISGAGTWFGESKKTVELCDDLQNFFWRVMLKVPESCPKVALRSETGMIGMKWRIWQEKILLLLRIRNHDKSTLCRQVYEEGRNNGWPGLGQEVASICQALGIPDANKETLNKKEVKQAILENHYNDMVEEIKEKKKLDSIKDEDFREVQPYFKDKSVEKVRMAFKVRTLMVPEIPGNFKNKFRGRGSDGLKCSECEEDVIMTQSHCLVCPAWEEIREGLDLGKMDDLVVFFRKLLVERLRSD